MAESTEREIRAAYRHCARVVAASRSSFAATFWMLSGPQRRAMHAVYAFCRRADDIADDPKVRGDRGRLLAQWREELDAVYAGRACDPVGVALAHAVTSFSLPRRWFDELLEGIEIDLAGRGFESFEDVERYCYCVAATVGQVVVTLLGARGREVETFAIETGVATQLTNILRDVGDDARNGRVYLARADLMRHGLTREMIGAGRRTPALRNLLGEYADRARLGFERARACLPPDQARALRPALAMGALYRELLHDLVRADFPGIERPVRLSKVRRWTIAARVFARPGAPA